MIGRASSAAFQVPASPRAATWMAGIAEDRAPPILSAPSSSAGLFITSAQFGSCHEDHALSFSGSTIVSPGPTTASGFQKHVVSASRPFARRVAPSMAMSGRDLSLVRGQLAWH